MKYRDFLLPRPLPVTLSPGAGFCAATLEHPPDRVSVVSPWMVCLRALQSLTASVGLWGFPLPLASSGVSVQACVAIPVDVPPQVRGWSPAVVLMVASLAPRSLLLSRGLSCL